jgi:multiple sugar transport system substrate-binding protein
MSSRLALDSGKYLSPRRKHGGIPGVLALLLLGVGLAATALSAQRRPDAAKQRVAVWFNAGLGQALTAMKLNIEDFHAAQSTYTVDMTIVPEGTYADAIRVAGTTGDLPCLLLLDGPLVPHFAWLGYLRPLDRFVSKELKADFLPSMIAQGTYRERLYALGAYDSGLAIFGNRRHLRAARVRMATVERPWTLGEFEGALERLSTVPGVEYALDMKVNYGRGEFYTFAFSPILQSMGGDLIDRRTYQSAKGVLDGPQSVAAMKRLQSWFQKGWVNPRPADDDDFTSGRAALSWVGHWAYARYAGALGKDLVLLPMPDLGRGPKTGLGAWTFSVCSSCRDPAGAWALLRYILRRDKILRWTALHSGVPARKSALAQSPLYAPGGALNIYVQQAQRGWPVPRPITPAYAAITAAFAEAVDDIIKGGDVQTELTNAADKIDQDIRTHLGYQ